MKRYKSELDRQERVNESLKREIERNKPSVTEQMEAYSLKQNYERLKKMYNAIPEEIRREAARAHKPKNIDRGGR